MPRLKLDPIRSRNLTNDYALLGIDDAQHQFLLKPTVTGYAQSAWAIGYGAAAVTYLLGLLLGTGTA